MVSPALEIVAAAPSVIRAASLICTVSPASARAVASAKAREPTISAPPRTTISPGSNRRFTTTGSWSE